MKFSTASALGVLAASIFTVGLSASSMNPGAVAVAQESPKPFDPEHPFAGLKTAK